MNQRSCVYENCPAQYIDRKWQIPAGTEIPDSVPEHKHSTARFLRLDDGGTQGEDDAPTELCAGYAEPPTHSTRYTAALTALNDYLTARKVFEKAYRELLGRSILVPENEQDELVVAALQAFEAHGFPVPERRGVTLVDVSNLIRIR